MFIDDVMNTKIDPTLGLGNFTVTFKRMSYNVDRTTGRVKSANIEIEGYEKVYIPIFEEDNSYIMKDFLRQLNWVGKPWNPDLINKECKGMELKIYRYTSNDGRYTNTSFNPNAGLEAKNSTLAMRI